MRATSLHLSQRLSNRAVFIGLRALAVAASIAACTSLAGCAPDTIVAGNASPWAAVGNNGGKADRYAIARAAASDASMQIASAPAAGGKAQ